MGFYETSAKQGTNVNRAFEELIDSMELIIFLGLLFLAIY
jgi:hypothetical protein